MSSFSASSAAPSSAPSAASPARSWWSYGHVWLVIAGPLLVVVASFVTFYLAANGQDPVLSTSSSETSGQKGGITEVPAIQARNHAATGQLPVKAAPK